jgi:AcrR family transcriptional regulator
MTRGERKQQTRAHLIETARDVFVRRGFHDATLDEIAEEAGFTKGAIYSNFNGKDGLFLEVLDAQIERRWQADMRAALSAESLEASFRAVARNLIEATRETPRWMPVLMEFWTHASGNPELRAKVSERHERNLDWVAEIIAELGARYRVEFRIPTREVGRGAAALARGMSLERLLDSQWAVDFEDTFVSFVLGFIKQTNGSAEGKGG